MRPTTYSDGMTQVSVGVPQLRRIAAQLPPLAGRPDVPGLVDRFGRVARDLACRCFF
jgi:GTP 3',8-cyclase